MPKTREERIRERAYAIWEREGGQHGRHDEHWQRAETEIGAERPTVPPSPEMAPTPARSPADQPVESRPAARAAVASEAPKKAAKRRAPNRKNSA